MEKMKPVTFTLTDKMTNELKKAYQEALKKPEFEALVKELHLPVELLMKHTSHLEEASIEYDHCKHCRGLLHCKNKITGYAYMPHIENGQVSFCYQACRYKQKKDKETKYLKNMKLLHVPDNMKQASMKDIYMDDERRFEVIKYITQFIKNYRNDPHQKGLYLHGSFGSGKTYLIAALFNELEIKKHANTEIVYFPELLRNMKEDFSLVEDKLNYLQNVDILLIDDIGAENVTVWGRDEILGTILQYRMNNKLTTFFTSNLTIEELERHLSLAKGSEDTVKARRIIERIKQLTDDIEIVSENRRK